MTQLNVIIIFEIPYGIREYHIQGTRDTVTVVVSAEAHGIDKISIIMAVTV